VAGEQTASWDQITLEAWAAKVNAGFEKMLRDVDREREQANDWHAFALEHARNDALIVNRMAGDNATLSTRIANNAATFDNLIFAGEVDVTAQGATGANVAKEAASAAKQAVDSSIAGMATTGGVAQGAMQTGASVATVDLVTQVSKLAGVVDVLLAKVTALETAKPAA
jgi:translation initiation factor 2 alpha subunit (eIF-2alpha)